MSGRREGSSVVEAPSPQRNEYFDSLAEGWAGRYQTSRFFKQRMDVVLSLIDRHCTGVERALDFGCGAGVFSTILASRFKCVSAVDRSERMRAVARQALAPYPTVTVMGPDDLASERFDFILCTSVIEYVQEDADFLKTLGNLLTPQGRLLISFPNRWGPLQLLSRYVLKHVQADSYVHYQVHTYTKKGIKQMAQTAGLRCDEMVYGVGIAPLQQTPVSEQIFAVMKKM
jgi:2-polyprenyl-3-methyl-5-hydroxy-6-metoxy-1,4-benzoquinol methylase